MIRSDYEVAGAVKPDGRWRRQWHEDLVPSLLLVCGVVGTSEFFNVSREMKRIVKSTSGLVELVAFGCCRGDRGLAAQTHHAGAFRRSNSVRQSEMRFYHGLQARRACLHHLVEYPSGPCR